MVEFEEVDIQIRRSRKSIPYRALSSPQMSCNIIERACVEELKQQWTPSNDGINYDFSDHASPPLGRCELDWGWQEGSATVTDTFIVVEEIKGTPYRVILGPAVAKLPFAPSWDIDILTIVMSRQSEDDQERRRERDRLAALRRPEEKAVDDARIRERRAKKKREEQDNAQKAKLA